MNAAQASAVQNAVARHERRADAFVPQVRGHDGKGAAPQQHAQIVGAVIELVIAERHNVGLHQLQHFRLRGSLCDGAYGRALQIVSGVEENHVLLFSAEAVRVGLQCRRAADLDGRFSAGTVRLRHLHRCVLRMEIVVVENAEIDAA